MGISAESGRPGLSTAEVRNQSPFGYTLPPCGKTGGEGRLEPTGGRGEKKKEGVGEAGRLSCGQERSEGGLQTAGSLKKVGRIGRGVQKREGPSSKTEAPVENHTTEGMCEITQKSSTFRKSL